MKCRSEFLILQFLFLKNKGKRIALNKDIYLSKYPLPISQSERKTNINDARDCMLVVFETKWTILCTTRVRSTYIFRVTLTCLLKFCTFVRVRGLENSSKDFSDIYLLPSITKMYVLLNWAIFQDTSQRVLINLSHLELLVELLGM